MHSGVDEEDERQVVARLQELASDATSSRGASHRAGTYAFWGLAGATAAASVALLPFLVVPWLPKRVFGALPWMQTPQHQLTEVFTLLSEARSAGRATGTFVDLGSGDGCAVIEAARRGYTAHGVELNPALVLWSRLQARRARVNATFSWGNMFAVPLAPYDVVMCFGVPSLMPRLAEKVMLRSVYLGHVHQLITTIPIWQ
eukprot:TRINITY_DN1981_c0_g1_i1.p1 TRINITY_DN1981_c0_g1~~TRINITY_DN1981_c0_g1_i1.p1  ORF type:complete len:201 (-),score=33.78 TRINITY_DN1981_c0_g1_i1:431-1033(-)